MKPKIGFLITHGTDTMAWGLSFLSYTLKNCPHPVAFVGSQRPMTPMFSSSDGYANIELAVTTILSLSKPVVFLAFSDGRKIFVESVWKKDKWDIDAFTGKIIAEKRSNDLLTLFKFTKKLKPLDKLYIIRTGGTIEASVTEKGTIDAGRRIDVAEAFIENEFKNKKGLIGEVIDIPLLSKDSSDMTPKDWLSVALKIKEISEENGYKTRVDEEFNANVPIIFASPINNVEHYRKMIDNADGFIFVGYGAGNINILENSPYSPLNLFRYAVSRGKTVVLSSHAEEGILDSVYENGAEIFRNKLALPALDFSLARAQVKLGALLAHKSEIFQFAPNHVTADKLFKIIFLSGAKFASQDSKRWFEDIFDIKIPEEDLLINREFDEALEMALGYIERTDTSKVIFIKDIPTNKVSENMISVVKLDEFVGEDKMGVEIDSGQTLANILTNAFEWEASIINLWETFDDLYKLFNYIRSSHIIFWESGRPQLSELSSFSLLEKKTSEAIPEYYTSLFEITLNERANKSEFPPSIFIGLSHHFLIKGLKSMLEKSLDSDIHWIPSDVRTEWVEIVDELKIKRPERDLIDGISFDAPVIATLETYSPSKGIDKDFVYSHDKISKLFSGAIEDILPHDKVDIPLIHGDSINEEWALYLNFAFTKIRMFREKYKLISLENLVPLPIGIEITSSLRFGEHEIEVASISVYYKDAEGILTKDISYQFHPHLLFGSALYPPDLSEGVKIDFKNDGIKLLLWSILSVLERIGTE